MTTNTTNILGDTPPTVCPVCTGVCTLPGEGPTGQLGGLCTVCGWDYLADADQAPGDALSTVEATAADREAYSLSRDQGFLWTGAFHER